MALLAKIAAAAAAASVAFTGVAVATQASPLMVDRVVDGDTIDVWMLGKTVRVRLLNIDAPETKDPSQPTECLGPEAAKFLEARLPRGTQIDLQYDIERYDNYGRTLAGVFESGSLVNAEIAAAGLGAPVVFEPNRRFHPEVLAAAQEAEAQGAGAYAPDVECTLPSQVVAAAAALTGSTADDYDGWTVNQHLLAAKVIKENLAKASELRASLASEDSASDPPVKAFHSAVQRQKWLAELDHGIALGRAQQLAHEAAVAEIREAARVEAEKAAQAKAEAERVARAKAEAERKAKEKAEAERKAREEAAAQQAAEEEEAEDSDSSYAYYKNCSAARAAGAAPVHVGDPGYGRHLDRDGDGVGCEW